ncbi:MAG: hypothetical protein HC852_07615 [Acaryochloridaceae cyanobacterium RU_4_10]|nr:hypothetical protein [Acaryochloridaceae cyanobacterium RU_4_10]
MFGSGKATWRLLMEGRGDRTPTPKTQAIALSSASNPEGAIVRIKAKMYVTADVLLEGSTQWIFRKVYAIAALFTLTQRL